MKLFYFLPLVAFVFSCSESITTQSNANSTATQVDSILLNETDPIVENESPINFEFPSLDSLLISASLYEIDPNAETILLCHQAGYNRHEYDEIAPKLNDLGFNCITIDQRSGGIVFDIMNETTDRAITIELPVDYLDAEQDIIAAIDYSFEKYGKKIILWGSSYSSALALQIGANSTKLKAVVSFSPGDYFGDKKPLLSEIMPSFPLPFFITSSKSEAKEISLFLNGMDTDNKHIQFSPTAQGKHGSRALWENHDGNKEYWNAITTFLKQFLS